MAPAARPTPLPTQISIDPDAAPSGGEDLSALLRVNPRNTAPVAPNPQPDDAPVPQENALASLLKSTPQAQPAPTRATPDPTTVLVHATLPDAPANDAPTLAKAPDAPIALATSFGTDPAPAQVKAATAAYEVARAAMPILPASEQVALTVQRAIQDGLDRMTVQLKPAELGRVSAEIEFHDDHRVHVVLSAERPATLDALRQDSRALERALQDAGLRADAGSLSFRFQNGNGGNGGSALPGNLPQTFAVAAQPQLHDDTAALATQRMAMLRGGVDIRV